MFKNISVAGYFMLAALLSVTALTSAPALASSTCNNDSDNDAVAAGAMSIPANAAPGTMIKSVQTTSIMQCRDTTSSSASFITYVDLQPTGPLVSGYTDVYQTNISGIGVRYTFNAPNCTDANAVIISGTGKTRFSCPFTTGTTYVKYPLNANMDFIVTGTLPASSTLTSVSAIKLYFSNSDIAGGPWAQDPPISGVASGSVTASTCSVNQKSIGVTLDTVTTTQLSGPIGVTVAPKPFTLSLTCPEGIKTFVTLTDSTNTANLTTTLALTPDSSAQGVGIQILNSSDTPVAFGPDSAAAGNLNQFLLGTSVAGVTEYPFKAQYISTGNVRAGTVKAIATFTLSYQ